MDEHELKQYRILFQWRNLLDETRIIVSRYTEEEQEFLASLAGSVWSIWKNKQDNLFQSLHSRCCNFDDLFCTNITARIEQKVVRILIQMSNNKEYAGEILALGSRAQRFDAPSATRLRQALKTAQVIGTEMIQHYLRIALWKDHLGMQLTLLESYLCHRDGIDKLGLRTIPDIWLHYKNLKERIVYCYKRPCCRYCLKKCVKLIICRDCRCVYFCQEGYCAVKSREDIYWGHSKEECLLLMENKKCL